MAHAISDKVLDKLNQTYQEAIDEGIKKSQEQGTLSCLRTDSEGGQYYDVLKSGCVLEDVFFPPSYVTQGETLPIDTKEAFLKIYE